MAKRNRRLMAIFGGSVGFAAVSSQFLDKHLKATAIPKLTAVTHFWLCSCVSFNGFKKWHIRPSPLYALISYATYHIIYP